MMKTVGQSNANPVNQTESEALRLAIREEVKEMKEREKIKSSIVVNGLEVPSGRQFVEMFEDVWKYILGTNKVLQLSDIVYINRDKKLYRAKIKNVENRSSFIISNSKRRKDSSFRNMFINRDLTYNNQRRELFTRREEATQLDIHSGDPTTASLSS